MTIQKKHSDALDGNPSENLIKRGSQEQTSELGLGFTGCKSKVSTNLIGLVSSDFAILKAAEDHCRRLSNINILFY